MREWRVGTISMGASLILLGVLLFVSQFNKIDLMQIFFSWWPFILIVLGVEIVLYIFLAKKETVAIKYDFLSIIFIGVLGTIALGFMFLTFSGILHEVRHVVSYQEETYDLPTYTENVTNEIDRIVLDVGRERVRLEGTNRRMVQLFGTYRTSQPELSSKINEPEDYISVVESDNTLFIKVKSFPEKSGIVNETMEADLVVLLPTDVSFEFNRNRYGSTSIRPGLLKADWYISDPSDEISIPLLEQSDIEVTVYRDKQQVWKTGNGTYKLHLAENEPDQVNVFVQ